jgi:hypothetical protein
LKKYHSRSTDTIIYQVTGFVEKEKNNSVDISSTVQLIKSIPQSKFLITYFGEDNTQKY